MIYNYGILALHYIFFVLIALIERVLGELIFIYFRLLLSTTQLSRIF